MGRQSTILDSADCDYVRETYAYDPDTGTVTFRSTDRTILKAGKVTGLTVEKGGYRVMCVNLPSRKRLLKVHLVAWLLFYRVWPDHEVDHWDGDKTNCRVRNLRRATNEQNRANIPKYSSYGGKPTSSQYKGVTWHKKRLMWMSYIRVDKKLITLGYFDDEREAALTYDNAATKYYNDFAVLNFLTTDVATHTLG